MYNSFRKKGFVVLINKQNTEALSFFFCIACLICTEKMSKKSFLGEERRKDPRKSSIL